MSTAGEKDLSAKDRYMVPGLERGFRLLRCFSREHPVRPAGELARLLDLPRSTVFRLLHTLETMGLLLRDDGAGGYRLGPAVLGLGFEYLSALELPEIARPTLDSLSRATGASVHLSIRDRDEIIYVSRHASRSSLASNIRVGSRLAAHASSMGRVLLADLDDREFDEIYGDGRALEGFTDQTPRDIETLRALLRDDAARGYVVSRSFYERGVVSVAAALRDATGRAVGAINITAAEQSVDRSTLEGEFKDRVCDAARAISASLGGASSPIRSAAE
jgi:DNA-binding IclR family transcriptional regulator